MNTYNALAFVAKLVKAQTDYATDAIAGSCCPYSHEDQTEVLNSMSDTVVKEACLAIEAAGGDPNYFQDGTPVEPVYNNDDTGKVASRLRRPGDPLGLLGESREWLDAPMTYPSDEQIERDHLRSVALGDGFDLIAQLHTDLPADEFIVMVDKLKQFASAEGGASDE